LIDQIHHQSEVTHFSQSDCIAITKEADNENDSERAKIKVGHFSYGALSTFSGIVKCIENEGSFDSTQTLELHQIRSLPEKVGNQSSCLLYDPRSEGTIGRSIAKIVDDFTAAAGSQISPS
jgi:hypothetical protein